MVYVVGGFAWASAEWKSGNNAVGGGTGERPGPWSNGIGSANYQGSYWGGGVEHKFSNRVSVFLEGTHVNYGNKDYTFTELDDNALRSVNLGLEFLKVTAGFNFRF